MNLVITDNNHFFKSSNSNKKVLISKGIILESNFLSRKEIENFNSSLNAIEAETSELMIEKIKIVASNCPDFKVNPFLKTRDNTFDIAYSLLYVNFKAFVTQYFFIKLFVEKFYKAFSCNEKIDFYLNELNQLIQNDRELQAISNSFKFYTVGKSEKISFIKNSYYKFYNLFYSPKSLNKYHKKHIVLFIYDIHNEVELFSVFFKNVQKSNIVHLSVVLLSSGGKKDNVCSIDHLKSENISVYKIEKFRNYVKYNNKDFYETIGKLYPEYKVFSTLKKNENLEIYYMYINEILNKLKPDVAVYSNTGEIGRAVSDVSRYFKIPSVNVEYGLFSDDAIYMESNIKYTLRACLGQASIDVWKKRNDPTLLHEAIGFLKLDNVDLNAVGKDNFFSKNNLKPNTKTIFFASTWGGTNELYNIEKRVIVKNIALYAKEIGWNFIIKKHPAETDNHLDEELALLDFKNVKIFNHKDLSLYFAINISDIVITQFSAISVEAMYLNKSTIFYNLNSEKSFVDTIVMKNEKFIYKVSNNDELNNAINKIIVNSKEEYVEIEKSKLKYLYKTDGKASERLLNLLYNIKI
ncbi:MAG: CDP-glycerol glycerophosphotransferase family protein [Bacteroidia bacterium]|nr:CDP-glycerol glycerophosphotransferase family protein [Bacteroidia bacterium]